VIQQGFDQNGPIFKTADPIFAVDHKCRIVLWNEGAESLLGHVAKDVLGKSCHELMGCRNGGGELVCHANCMELMKTLQQDLAPTFEKCIPAKSGVTVPLSVTTILVPSKTRELSVLVHLLRDLTRQKEIETLLHSVVTGAARLSLGSPDGSPQTKEAGQIAPPAITQREREVIRLLARGASTETIAAKLFISNRTARNHIQHILAKLQVHSRLEAVAYALTNALL
jgi:PAS domain S-box-containing protein